MNKMILSVLCLAASTAFSAPHPDALKEGISIPEVQVKNLEGKDVALHELVKSKPSALVFYRGGWCRFCIQHLKGLSEIHAEIQKKGYQLIALSPDSPEQAKKMVDSLGFGFTVLSDSPMAVSKAFNLAFTLDEKTRALYKKYEIDLEKASGQNHYQLPHPAVYVFDASGKVIYRFVETDYKVRLEPENLLKQLKTPTPAP